MDKFDKEIQAALNRAADGIYPQKDLLYSIKNHSIREDIKMKRKITRTILVCGAVCALLSAAAIGAGKITSTESHSSHLEEITHYPTQNELAKYIDFAPAYPETLGGYTFKSCVPVYTTDRDEDGNGINDHTDLSISYNTAGGILTLEAQKTPAKPDKDAKELEYKGTKLYYHSILYKFVPPDYELTAEDEAQKAKGELEISYGSDEVELMQTQSLIWEKDGISYCLLDMDVQIEKEKFISMAEEVIDFK